MARKKRNEEGGVNIEWKEDRRKNIKRKTNQRKEEKQSILKDKKKLGTEWKKKVKIGRQEGKVHLERQDRNAKITKTNFFHKGTNKNIKVEEKNTVKCTQRYNQKQEKK